MKEITMDMHHIYDLTGGVVLVCSLLHSFLPPWDFLADFPRAQKYYKLFVYVVGYVALNARSTVYKSISVQAQEAPKP